jgi:adsorption protein B
VGEILTLADGLAAETLFPLALWILASGIDDLFIVAAWLFGSARGGSDWEAARESAGPERRIAIFVPLWQEAGVIAKMLEHNIAALRYMSYDFFVGTYPNDPETQEAVQSVAARVRNIHLCVCPHDGPTSKADCLNWIYQHMLLMEERTGARFEVIVTHDAEDVIHPDELSWFHRLMDRYAMIQTPVLPLATPARDWVHSLYCDDFAEAHSKDLPVRGRLGGFIPSAGVGTAYRREAIERLAESDANRVFEPECLTEDYENGMRLNLLGERQLFLPVRIEGGMPLATREYFPRTFRGALRQRTRWVIGIALQGWHRHGWGRDWRQWYWLWRDRKGLLGSPLGLYANLLTFYGLLTYLVALWTGARWEVGEAFASPWAAALFWTTTALMSVQLAAKIVCTSRVYGWAFGVFAPVRLLLGNLLNSAATLNAILQFAHARVRGRPLVWVKTEHFYPSPAALHAHRRPLGEILVGAGYLTESRLAWALASKPHLMPLGEHLLRLGFLSEEHLVEALSLQSGMPAELIDVHEISPKVARTLPARLQREWKVIAVRVAGGQLHLASPDVPDDRVIEELRCHTRLSLRFFLVTHGNYRQLCERLL